MYRQGEARGKSELDRSMTISGWQQMRAQKMLTMLLNGSLSKTRSETNPTFFSIIDLRLSKLIS